MTILRALRKRAWIVILLLLLHGGWPQSLTTLRALPAGLGTQLL